MRGSRYLLAPCLALVTIFLFCSSISAADSHEDSAPWFNLLHVTDVHGWVYGHRHNETLNTDFGDFTSLLIHLRQQALMNGEEFFAFDTGDLIEGTGLSDATPIHGVDILKVVSKLHEYTYYDALTMGNHDVEDAPTVNIYEKDFIPTWHGSYLTANIISQETGSFLGNPYTLINSQFGYKILVLGYIFDFLQHSNNTNVVLVNESVTEPYFNQAMNLPDSDLIIVLMHINPPSQIEFQQIYQGIRKAKPESPLVILSGHGHILYHEDMDSNAMTIESGCFFQTLGFVRFQLTPKNSDTTPQKLVDQMRGKGQEEQPQSSTGLQLTNLSYKWIETSMDNFLELTGLNEHTFPTDAGSAVKKLIYTLYNDLNLNETIGCMVGPIYSPSVAFDQDDSLYGYYLEEILPSVLFENYTSSDPTPVGIVNTGMLRYPLFPGVVILDDIYTIDPFHQDFVRLSDISQSDLNTFLTALNLTTPDIVGPSRHHHVSIEPMTQPYYWYPEDLTQSPTYDLIFTAYDQFNLNITYYNVFGKIPDIQPFPSSLTETSVFIAYISKFFPCST